MSIQSGKYSQGPEDYTVLDLFGGFIGRFLDIGAADGVELSNTRLLAEHGWSGVCVEPHPLNYARLVENTRDLPLVKTICAAVRGYSCVGEFHFQTGNDYLWWSTGHEKQYRAEADFGARQFTTKSDFQFIGVDELYADGVVYDFVSVDTDGYDFEIMSRIVEIYPPTVFCAEVCGNDATLEQWLSAFNQYEMVLRTPENIVMKLK